MYLVVVAILEYFNSRPREGANRIDKDARIHDGISIPAPARGRTVRTARPARSGQFQFPPPRGGEHPAPSKNPVQRISIPAPARGRTGTGLTRHRGLEFQFPPPRGGEPPNWAGRGIPTRYFNSRPREGANAEAMKPSDPEPNISIPAPARGRTPWFFRKIHAYPISIPAPARGRTGCCRLSAQAWAISIPAPARGRTFPIFLVVFHRTYFNSRPREGANKR